jgi:hypothetical protein
VSVPARLTTVTGPALPADATLPVRLPAVMAPALRPTAIVPDTPPAATVPAVAVDPTVPARSPATETGPALPLIVAAPVKPPPTVRARRRRPR